MIGLDERDLAILKVLSREGRIAKADLARRINLSPTPCWNRLKRLEKAGVITCYRATISLRKLGPNITVFVLAELDGHRAEQFQRFERAIATQDEVQSCWAIGGGFDYLMQVVVHDLDAYQRLMEALLEAQIGLSRYYSYVVTKPVKDAPPPLELLSAVQINPPSDAPGKDD